MQRIWILGISLLSVAAAHSLARAQSFPPDSEWVALECGGQPMSDRFQDESGALSERDIVGDQDAPAGLRAADDDFLYLRLRVDADPVSDQGTLRPFAWGMEFDLDGDVTTYEILVLATGAGQNIKLASNETTTLPDDPNDPADEPAVANYAFADNGRSAPADDSSFGDTPDRFLDLAIPWADLEQLGVEPATGLSAWAATSSTQNSLNADFACHDGTTGEPSLSDTVSDPTTADPDEDPGGGGTGGGGDGEGGGGATGEGELAGGGGCSVPGDGGASGLLLALLVGLRVSRRRPS